MLIDVAHSFVNLFAGGRSEIKTLLFFCYLLLLLGTYLLFKKSNVRVKWRLPLKWPIIVLCVGYLYGLVLHLWYSMSLSVSPMDFLITGRNGELSSTTLTHIHEPKGAIAQTLSLFGIGGLRTSDAGGAYIGEVPGWVLSLGTVAIVTAIVPVTVYFVTTFLPSVVLKSPVITAEE